MATSFEEIYDLALVMINDYRLNNLYKIDKDAFLTHMQGYLVNAIPMAEEGCERALEYNATTKVFNDTLNSKIKKILADAVVIVWFEGIVNDTTQVNNLLQGRDKKTFSAAQNLKEKSEYLDRMREKFRQDITDYQINNLEI